jgi:hypothetical protein
VTTGTHVEPSGRRRIGGIRRAPPGAATFRRLDVYNAATDAEAVEAESATALLPRGVLRDDEIIILMLRPSVLYVLLAPAGSLLLILILMLALALVAAKAPWLGWHEEQAYVIGAALMAMRLSAQALDWGNRLYILTDQRIITRSGVLRVCWFEAHLRSIQHTSVFMRMRERLCGLGSIGFATAGSDVFDTFWLMLRQPFHVHRTITETIRRYGGPRH